MILEKEKIVNFIKKVEDLLGLELFLVGGAVRDLLVNKPTKDFDFTTSANPEEIENKIREAGFKPYLLGKKYGTIGFKLEGDLIEITTFRSEIYSPGNRKPEVGFHSDIKYDLERRDLTINAMAFSSKGDLIDLFGGQNDLKNKVIRCVGDPNLRFSEDPLRMLRAIRFAGQYEFELEQDTARSIQKNYWRLLDISKERWVMEMDKILSSPDPSSTLDLFKNLGLAQVVLPEILLLEFDFQKLVNHDNYWLQTKLNIANLNPLMLDFRWAALLAQCARPFLLSNYLQQNYYTGISSSSNLETEVKDFANKVEIKELMESQYSKNFAVETALKISAYLKFSNNRIKKIKEFIQNS